jgi:DNA primase
MFPITGAGGKVVAFGGRTLGNDDAKYINSPESPIYNKSATLYGLHEGRQAIHKEDRVLLVEGYFDVLGLARAGLGFAVAPCGTALTERQLIAVRRHTRNVTALFDSDAAGKKAGMRALELCLDQGLWPQWLAVPDGKDPDDFVRAHGGDAMRELLKSARPLIDVYLEDRLAAAGSDLPSRDAVLKDLLPMLGKLGESVRRGYVYQVAGALNLDPIETERRARQGGATRGTPVQAAPASAPASAPARAPASAPAAVPAPSRPKASAPERELLKLLVQDLAQMAPLVDEKGLVSFVRHPDVERAVGVMLRAWREGREPDGIELLADIADDEVRHELSSVLADEDSWYSADVRAKARHECVYRLASDWIAQRRAGLAAEIARIERQSPRDTARLRELITESAAFDRQRHTLLRQLLPDALQGRLGEA